MTTVTDPLTYYAAQSQITDPKEYAPLFDDLPTDLEALHRAINGVLIHNWKIRRDKIDLPPERKREIEVRGVARMLTTVQGLEPGSLTVKRPREQRMVIDCRHFATLLCAVLRQRGIPARVRVGFATYLEKTHFQDHWVCEYWRADEGRWVLEDADLCLHDVSREEFITAAEAWRRVKMGEADPDRFGYSPDMEMRGAWAVRFDLVRDFAALNKVEMLSLDSWGDLMSWPPQPPTEDQAALLDRASALALGGGETFAAMRALYAESDLLRVSQVIDCHNYTINETHRVDWWAAI